RRKTYEAVHKIHDAITEAKWAHHPNWKRVERSFERAKQRLLEVVSGEPLPEPQKALMLERIRDVTLHLPLSDPSVFGWRKIGPCSTTKNNASYTSLTNRVTVCAGLFNSYASEATLFGVIAHELGHSVDPSGLSSGRVENGTALSLLRGVVQAGSKIECSDWTRRKGELLGKPSPVPEANPLGKLYECLVADFRTMRRPWNATVMEADAWRDSDDVISGLVSNRAAFTRLTARLDAGVDDVEGLLQPDADHVHINCAHRADDAAAQYVFLQEWRCNGNPNKGVRMKEAIAGVASILRRKSMETNALCGGYCGDGPSDPTVGEYFSDWLAVRAIEKDLASLSPSQRLARAAEASVFWCENPAETRALELEEVSERDLVNVHPYTGTRFNAFVSRKARQEIGCRMDEDEPRTYAECKP
ncbi:MAG: hypothetical protein HUU37_08190, partial [Bdellovibrionales bacterium]|nr:hypothetical protein [Bdellovibrionales bacterium]